MENELAPLDDLSIDVNTIAHTIDDMQQNIYNLRRHIKTGFDPTPILSLQDHNGTIEINTLPDTSKIEIRHMSSPRKNVIIHRESLLLLYMLLPDTFSATEITELLKTLPFIDINVNASPQLIMKFFAFVFDKECKVISKGKKSKLTIQKV